MTSDQGTEVGTVLRHWRSVRGFSQMRLAHTIGISPRHMSFVETGRSRPSREVAQRLAGALRLPLREENALLEAAGHARRYTERHFDAPEMAHVRAVLRFLIDRHMPNSAVVIDRAGDVHMYNEAHVVTLAAVLRGRTAPPHVAENIYRLAFHPDGLRPVIMNWSVVAPTLMNRLEAELAETPSAARLRDVVAELRSYGPVPASRPASEEVPPELMLPIELDTPAGPARLVSLFTTLGTPIDVTLQELRIESFFPADAESAEILAELADPASRS